MPKLGRGKRRGGVAVLAMTDLSMTLPPGAASDNMGSSGQPGHIAFLPIQIGLGLDRAGGIGRTIRALHRVNDDQRRQMRRPYKEDEVMDEAIAYKILTTEELAALEAGTFDGAEVDRADGYIHLSTAAQLRETLEKHFAGQDDLAIAAVDLAALGDAIRWESSRGGQLFPHLYGTLTLDTVIAYGPLERHEDGAIPLPVAG
jgi:uncharacterized protein (DUF952 family)